MKDVFSESNTLSHSQSHLNILSLKSSTSKITIVKILFKDENFSPLLTNNENKNYYLSLQKEEEEKFSSTNDFKNLENYLIDRGEIKEDEIDKIIYKVLLAIQLVHSKGFSCHSNFSLKNILLENEDLNSILVDFPKSIIDIKNINKVNKHVLFLKDYEGLFIIALSLITGGKKIDLIKFKKKLTKNFEGFWKVVDIQSVIKNNGKYKNLLYKLINWKNEEEIKMEKLMEENQWLKSTYEEIIKDKNEYKKEKKEIEKENIIIENYLDYIKENLELKENISYSFFEFSSDNENKKTTTEKKISLKIIKYEYYIVWAEICLFGRFWQDFEKNFMLK